MSKPTIYLVPHTHYDAVWVFSKRDYFYINIDMILKQAVELAAKTGYKFLVEQVFLLKEVEKNYPRLFSDVQRLVKKGKMEIAGGQYLLCDTMMPHGEVLIREITEGRRYVKEKFGIEPEVAWCADEFGFNVQCPQILKACGYKYFAFRRGLDNPKPSEFLWQGLDGTRIISHWMPLGYRAGLDLTRLDESYKKLKASALTSQILMPSGSGVTLPQPETEKAVKDWNRRNKPRMVIANSSEFFKALEKEKANFPVRKGEMYSGRLSEVFPNCTSSRIWIKQGMKEFENLLLALERWNALCNLTCCRQLEDQIKNYWDKLMFMAMHDVLPGTGIDEVYAEVKETFGSMDDTVKKSLVSSLEELSRVICKDGDLVVFNPLSWEAKNWVEATLEFKKGEVKGIAKLKSSDETIDVETISTLLHEDGSIKKATIGFVPTVPAMGFKVYKMVKGRSDVMKRVHKRKFVYKGFLIDVDPETGVMTISKGGKVWMKGNELLLEEELGDLYYHRENLGLLKSETGKGVKYGKFKVEAFKVAESRLRTHIFFDIKYYALRWPYRLLKKMKPLMYRHKQLDVKKEIVIYKHLPRIDFITHVRNDHPHSRLRVKFDTGISSKTYWSGTQFGAIERKTNQFYYDDKEQWAEKPCGVFPALEWMDYSDGRKGMMLLNQGLPAHEVSDDSIYLTLLRSVLMVSADGIMGPAVPTPDAAETNKHYSFRYSIIPHARDWRSATSYLRGMEFNMPLVAIQMKSKNDKCCFADDCFSFLSIEPSNVVVSSIKKGNGCTIVRFYETEGKNTRARLSFGKSIKSAKIADMLENEIGEVRHGRNTIDIKVGPFKIVTLKMMFY